MEKIEFEIVGMHCEGCSTRLENLLKSEEGILDANVSFNDKKAKISYDAKKISQSQIISIIQFAGFDKK